MSKENKDIFIKEEINDFLNTIKNREFKENIINYNDDGNSGYLKLYKLFEGINLGIVEYQGKVFSFEHKPLENILQINYCLEGRLGWQLDNGDCLYLGEHDISIHTLKQCANSKVTIPLKYYRGIVIFIDTTLCNKNTFKFLEDVNFDVFLLRKKFCHINQTTVIPATNNIEKLFNLIDVLPEQAYEVYLKLEVQTLLLYLFFLDISKIKEQKSYSREIIDIIKQIHQKIVSNLDKKYTIEDLSKEFLINQSTLKKVFKAVYGKPIAQYIKFYRMKIAANLLCKSDLSVGEIAIKLGYENQSKFAGAFREVMQISPLKYRKNYKM